MYVLLYWKKEKSVSTVKETEDLKNLNEGEEVNLYIDGKKYAANLLTRSESKDYLDKLIVSKKGEILKKTKAKQKDVQLALKKEYRVLTATQLKERKNVQKNVNESLLKLKPLTESMQKEGSSSHENNEKLDSLSDIEEDKSDTASNSAEKEEHAYSNGTETEENLLENEDKNSDKEIPQLCFPTVTPEIVNFFESLAVYLRGTVGGRPSLNFPFPTNNTNVLNQRETTSNGMVSIVNDEVHIDPRDEIEFTRFKKKPEEMARRLLLDIFGARELKTMTALGVGRGDNPGKGIPKNIRNAVYRYVKAKSSKGYTYSQYTCTINNQCNTLRHPKIDKNQTAAKSDSKQSEEINESETNEEQEQLNKKKSSTDNDILDDEMASDSEMVANSSKDQNASKERMRENPGPSFSEKPDSRLEKRKNVNKTDDERKSKRQKHPSKQKNKQEKTRNDISTVQNNK